MIVRKLKAGELGLLTRLHTYHDVDEMLASNRRRMESGVIDIFCAFENGLLLGELRVAYEHENSLFAQSGHRAYLYAFRVRQSCQGQGIGTRLLEAVLAVLSEAGYQAFTVGVEEDNPRARHMYEKQGFVTPIAQIRECYQGDSYEYDLLLKQTSPSR